MCSCIRSSIIYLLVLTHNPISVFSNIKSLLQSDDLISIFILISPVCTRYIEQYFLSEPDIKQPCLSVPAAIIPPSKVVARPPISTSYIYISSSYYCQYPLMK